VKGDVTMDELTPKQRKEIYRIEREDEERHESRFHAETEAELKAEAEVYQQYLKDLSESEKVAKENAIFRMYHEVPVVFLRRNRLTDLELRVFMGFLAFAHIDTLRAYVSVKKWAETAGVSFKHIYRPIRSLASKGYVIEMKENNLTKLRKAVFIPWGTETNAKFTTNASVRIPLYFLKMIMWQFTGMQLKVILGLLSYADANLVCVSTKELQKAIGGSIVRIRSTIKILYEAGFLEDTGMKDGHTKVWRINMTPTPQGYTK
jgi:hypothetical protein